ncbi:hypothetical protein K461DRAFT_321080 [Myriangium duriaei CBS 260.36]|uniref:Uncharacterized protein n=1 Tax=Myriangium duriaei CBS 260.36 TaxID=1168546 RepID=A0A9P4J3I4_9PEZI|nr:hypothetical protein K461DRAFT_321080 [Myriangium duriaei CBS 260.36]
MSFVCRGCAMQAQPISSANVPVRTAARHFSSSSRMGVLPRHSVPVFPESSSQELNTMLSTLRNDHLMPAFLSADQQRLIYRRKFQKRLENVPTTAEIRGEEFDLRPLDRNAMTVQRKHLIKSSIDTLIEAEDWAQVAPMLQGLAALGKHSSAAHMEKLIRNVAAAGGFGVVVQALRTAEWKKISVRTKHVRRAAVRGMRQTAEHGGWSKESVDRAVRHAEEVLLSFEDARHVGKLSAKVDPLIDPLLMAAWLELYAVRAYKYNDGKDEDGKVRVYFDRLVRRFDPARNEYASLESKPDLAINNEFMRLLPMWQGVSLAAKVLDGPALSQAGQLRQYAKSCGDILAKNVEQLRNGEVKPGSYADLAIKEYELAAENIK